jgi:alpha-galactosidase
MRVVALSAVLLCCAHALDNGLARTPPQGWMSWMYYTTEISESIIKGVADELVVGGYRDAGYK